MRERAAELKAEARKADGEKTAARVKEMPMEADRVMAERIHEIVKANAPDLSPKTWYGMPAYADKDGKVVIYFQDAASSTRGTRRSASTTRRTSTTAPCGRPPSR